MNCRRDQIHAYYDGELAPGERAAVEAHLSECADCRELLADLRGVSQLIATAPMTDMPPQAMKRMQQAWWAAQERGVLRLTTWLTAAAAAVIFAAVLLTPGPTQRTDGVPAGTLTVLMQRAEYQDPDEAQQDETIAAAQWIANDLSLAMR
jgi:anti-sigma factor RsiW